MEAWLMVGAIFGAMILWRLLLRVWPRNPYRSGILAASIVIASSTYSLFTESPDSLSFRLHAVLLIAMVVVVAIHVKKLRRA